MLQHVSEMTSSAETFLASLRRKLDTWKMCSKFLENFFIRFFPYIGFYKLVQHGHEQNKCMLHCASRVSYRHQIKPDCVNNVMQCTVHTTIRSDDVQATRLPLKFSTQYRQFLDRLTQYLIIWSPRVKNAWDVRSILSPQLVTYYHIY
jgi:hypothetical protein